MEDIGDYRWLFLRVEFGGISLKSWIEQKEESIIRAGAQVNKLFYLYHSRLIERTCLAVDILRGLEYLHKNQVAHRDLHIENILVQGNKAMITDFGRTGLDSRKDEQSDTEVEAKAESAERIPVHPSLTASKFHMKDDMRMFANVYFYLKYSINNNHCCDINCLEKSDEIAGELTDSIKYITDSDRDIFKALLRPQKNPPSPQDILNHPDFEIHLKCANEAKSGAWFKKWNEQYVPLVDQPKEYSDIYFKPQSANLSNNKSIDVIAISQDKGYLYMLCEQMLGPGSSNFVEFF